MAIAFKSEQKAGAGSAAPGADEAELGGGKQQLPAKMAREFLLGRRKLTEAAKAALNAELHDRALVARILAAHRSGAKLGAAVGGKGDLRALVRDPKFDWGGGGGANGGEEASGAAAGKAVQQRAAGPAAATAGDVHQIAADGLSGAPQQLPHLEAVQRSFGHHDVTGVEAHVGGPAQTASVAMGAQAYASGNAVAFRESPDLHTAAHEAAHVVQQRGGVQTRGGVGERGDAHEQHADAVADAVVRGQSAEGLLDAKAGGAAANAAAGPVQRQAVQFKLLDSDAIDALLDQVPPVKADTLPNYVKKVMAKAAADAKKPPPDKKKNEEAIAAAATVKFPQFAATSSDKGEKKGAVVKERKKLGTEGWNHIWRGDIGKKGHPTGFHWKGRAGEAINEGHGAATAGANGFYRQAVRLKPDLGKKVDGKEVKSTDKPDPSTFFPDDWAESEVKDAVELRNSQDQITTPEKGLGIQLQKSGETIYPLI